MNLRTIFSVKKIMLAYLSEMYEYSHVKIFQGNIGIFSGIRTFQAPVGIFQ